MSYWEHWLMRIQHKMVCQTPSRILKRFCSLFYLKSKSNMLYVTKMLQKRIKKTINLILTNKLLCFQRSSFIGTGLSDHCKLIATLFKSRFTKNRLIKKFWKSHWKFLFKWPNRKIELLDYWYCYYSCQRLSTFKNIFVREN